MKFTTSPIPVPYLLGEEADDDDGDEDDERDATERLSISRAIGSTSTMLLHISSCASWRERRC